VGQRQAHFPALPQASRPLFPWLEIRLVAGRRFLVQALIWMDTQDGVEFVT
jgi:hypothetical protein